MARGRVYTVTFSAVATTTTADLFDIAPASGKPITIMGFNVGSVGGTADAGDAQEELLSLKVVRGLATVGSGGTAASNGVTVNPVDTLSTAASFTARTMDTTIAVVGGGTTQTVWSDGWNNRSPYPAMFTDEQEISCSSTDTRLVVVLATAPADSLSISGTCWVRELL